MAINVKGGAQAPTPGPKPTTGATGSAQSIAQPKTSELFAAMATIKKQLGDKSIVYGNQIPNPERLATGVFEFDLACVVGSSIIQDAVTGVPHSIYELVSKKVPLPVASLNESNHKFDCGQITNWVSKGLRECYTITTEGGGQTTVAAEHAFLTDGGWLKANQLTSGVSLIRPLRFNWRFGDNLMDDLMLRFLAYWLADGNGTGDGPPKISDVDPDTVADFYSIAESKGYTLTQEGISYNFVGGPDVRNWKGQKVQTNIFRGMLLDLGVWGATAQHKQIPPHIFSLRKHQVAQFLSSMWMCDGTVHPYKKSASYSTVSPVLASQVQFMLQRLGIPAYTRSQPAEERVMPGGSTLRCLGCFTVYVTGDYSIRRLADTLTLMGDKHLRLQSHAKAADSNCESRLLRNRSGHSTYYSKIVSIEPAGLQEVYDVTVSPHHNLIIDGVIGHNTGGGFPKNRYSIVYGPESCLDKDTFIQFEVTDGYGKRQNHKGGTIEKLWHRFHGKAMPGKGHYQHKKTEFSQFTVPSINEEGRVFHNLVLDVVKTGVKPCYEITTESGLQLIATGEHKMFIGTGYVPVSALVEGSTVFIHNSTPFTKEGSKVPARPQVHVKHHPIAGTHVIDGKYVYKRLARSRAVMEALQNELPYDEYIRRLNAGELEGLVFLPTTVHVHHLDEDCFNDSPGNLGLLSSSEHGVLHAIERHNNLRYMAVPDKVVSCIAVGDRVTYDLRVESPNNNYVANGMVVHNSGKTNLVYKAIASAQRLPPPCNKAVFVDLEGTYSAEWAAQFGVDNDTLIVAKPSYGEQAVDMVDALVRASDVAFLAVDSIAVLVAARELDGSTEKADVGSAALLTKRLSNKLAVALSEEQKRAHNVCVVLLNQTRFKIGVMFGDPETCPGGQTVKFNASLIVRLFGKNKMVKEISSQVPAFKETHAVIKKAKIGITQAAFDYDMVMLEHDGLCPGDTASFNAVKGYLQSAGYLKKSEKGQGWDLLGKTYATQSIIQDTYYAEPEFAAKLNGLVVQSQTLSLVAAEPEQPSDYTAPVAPKA